MGPRKRTKRLREEDVGRTAASLCSGSSSDDEANRDLSLEIVERARRLQKEGTNMTKRDLKASKRPAPSFVELSSSDDVDGVSERRNNGDGVAPVLEAPKKKKKKKGQKEKKKKGEKKQEEEADEKESAYRGEIEIADTAMVKDDDEEIETADSIVTEVNDDICDNVVLRKLLRGPRYFDPGNSQWESCYNCGEEGHTAVNCTAEKRRKPCFVCGMFGHNAHKCTQGQDCVICKRRGHRSRDCPDKHRNTSGGPKICLRCGHLGHDMPSCRTDYPPNDLKKVQCYVCKSFGHLCCVNFVDSLPREVSCYNCGDSGHSGIGCAKPRGQSSGVASPALCYVCGEEGHFARGCTKRLKSDRRPRVPSDWRPSEPSTPSRPSKKKKDALGSKSLPHNLGKGYKNKTMQLEGTRSMTTVKPKIRDGWMADDLAGLPRRILLVKSPKSPRTPKAPVQMSRKHDRSAGDSYSNHVR